MTMTHDRAAGAAYIRVATGTVHESWPIDEVSTHLEVIVDVDSERRVLGVEILGRPGDGPQPILDAIDDHTIAHALADAGFDVPQLRDNPTLAVQLI